jgi:hypothetical protein
MYMVIFFNKNLGNSALKTREKPYYGKNSRKAKNPKLGLTNLVEQQIHLKPDAVSKHQRPYKLPPHKRDVLRHQLDELLSQGIIAPVNEKEHIPISCPIGLVSRRNRPNSGLETGSNEVLKAVYLV